MYCLGLKCRNPQKFLEGLSAELSLEHKTDTVHKLVIVVDYYLQ